jgi:hypothetical protein
MTKQLDIGSHNPRMQCAACGRWMRLNGRDSQGKAIQRFYGGCSVNGGDHPFDGDVCSDCCPTKCLEKLGCNCQAPFEEPGKAAQMSNDCPVHGLVGEAPCAD